MAGHTAPVALGPSRLTMLYRLWRAGKHGVFPESAAELAACRELRTYDYADRMPNDKYRWVVTFDGSERLLAPMRLVCKRAAPTLRLVKA